jgi:hypothetical protein
LPLEEISMVRNMTMATKGRVTKAGRAGAGGAIRLFSDSAAAGMEFAVPIDPDVLKTLSARPSTVKNLVDKLVKALARTQKSGQASGFTVMIDAKGNPKFEPLLNRVPTGAVPAEDDHLEAALVAARERGRLRSAQILDQSDMLTAEAFAGRLGVSRMTVNARGQKHELLGLGNAAWSGRGEARVSVPGLASR